MCEVCEGLPRRWSRRWIMQGAGAALAASALPGGTALAQAELPPIPVAVYPPPGYEFESIPDSIEEEYSDLEGFYQKYFEGMTGSAPERAYGLAIANQVIGLIRNDPAYIVRAGALYATHGKATHSAREKTLADLGAHYCRYLLSGDYPKASGVPPAVEPVVYEKDPPPTSAFQTIVLGRSVIRVDKSAMIRTQVDRVTRDWLLAFHLKGLPWVHDDADLFPSHEGARMSDLLRYSGGRMAPVWGMTATKVGDTWYAPDPSGAPRFEISPDKVREYPSTIVVDDHTAIVNDTHGISALAWDAGDASLVVGCGDHKGKMDAAFFLAARGVDVYTPTDRHMGLLIGARTKGTIIGSGPVTQTPGGAEIGNRPVEIDADEPIVVSNAAQNYPLQYYDSPFRYLNHLSEYVGRRFKITDVPVTEYGAAMNVVDAVREIGAKVLGIRVKSAKEHRAVAAWLREDRAHRAVLFHTAAYAEGYKLFAEFPGQTTFGDTRPDFA